MPISLREILIKIFGGESMNRFTLFFTFKKDKKGFTLIEILAVLMIMGVLLLIVFPSINNSNHVVEERLIVSQIESVINKASSDAITLAEDSSLTLGQNVFSYTSSKVNSDTEYVKGSTLNNEHIGTVIQFDKKGYVVTTTSFTFQMRQATFEFFIQPGYKQIFVNGMELETFKKRK